MRVITLSVRDPEQFLATRRTAAKATQPTWRAGLIAPGQLVDVKLPNCDACTRVIASSPSRSQQESTKYVDQTLIDVVAEGGGPCGALCGAREGDALLVSDVHGTGFCSIMYPDATISAAIEVRALAASSPNPPLGAPTATLSSVGPCAL